MLLPEVTVRVSVEQASTFGWERWSARRARRSACAPSVASAPIKDLVQKFGFTVDAAVAAALEQADAAQPAEGGRCRRRRARRGEEGRCGREEAGRARMREGRAAARWASGTP
ncbi:MAG: hypothetical protein U0842_12505 [Candidatus Binatia bacterium]